MKTKQTLWNIEHMVEEFEYQIEKMKGVDFLNYLKENQDFWSTQFPENDVKIMYYTFLRGVYFGLKAEKLS